MTRLLKIFGILILLLLFFGIPLKLYFNRNTKSYNNQNIYFEHFNVSFSGIVKDKEQVSNGAGIVTLDIITSSVKEYDVRDEYETYLCVIKNDIAEVIMNRLFLIQLDDSLVIDSKRKKMDLFRNSSLKESWDFQLPTNATFFYTFARWKHKL
ncbi:hypothetical protein [uncultured Aquimarina sp.]|uniref:hypothetical protein n=1 Tax=uncultured Aquimarina sp. TaxID=575652 RepID=UPI002637A598|nr:hypothetical protein [uncultured Aquimarina sp.]